MSVSPPRSGLESNLNSGDGGRKAGRTEQAGSLLAYSNKLAACETEARRPRRSSPALGFHMVKRKEWVCHQGPLKQRTAIGRAGFTTRAAQVAAWSLFRSVQVHGADG